MINAIMNMISKGFFFRKHIPFKIRVKIIARRIHRVQKDK